MKWSLKVARIAGIELRIHFTFFLLLAFIGLVFLAGGNVQQALTALIMICAVFFCVILHEFGHAFAARRYGIRTPDITLLPIGGLARLERIPEKPSQEFVIAIAGPLVNVVIAAVLSIIHGSVPTISWTVALDNPAELVPNLIRINVVLVLFNMIPAFPMDGGRVLRALLATRMNYARATELAASIGQGLSLAMGLVGFMMPSPILILIAIFIYFAAGQESSFAKIREATNGLYVENAMITDFRTLHAEATLQHAIDALLGGSQHDFPVIDDHGVVVGMLLRTDLMTALATHRSDHPVHDFVKPCPVRLQRFTSLRRAMELLQTSPCPSLPVFQHDGDNRIAGILTLENIGEMIMVNTAIAKRRRPS